MSSQEKNDQFLDLELQELTETRSLFDIGSALMGAGTLLILIGLFK